MAINFIRVSPTGSVLSTQPLTRDGELQNNLLEAQTYCGQRVKFLMWGISKTCQPGQLDKLTGEKPG
jgi:hypothetical protein